MMRLYHVARGPVPRVRHRTPTATIPEESIVSNLRSAKSLAASLVVAGLCLTAVGCGDSTTGPSSPGAGSTELSLSAVTVTTPAVLARAAEGDVTLTRARLLVRRVVLKQLGRHEVDFVTSPRVLDLPLDGTVTEFAVDAVPAGTYDEVRFDIHELDDDDPRYREWRELPEFADFVGRDDVSVILEGTVLRNGTEVPFVLRSDLNERQDVALVPPLVLSGEENAVNVTFVVDASSWFVTSSGRRLDPTDDDDLDEIEDRIENSIEGFRDDDRDGCDDDDDEDDDDDDDDLDDDDHGGGDDDDDHDDDR